MSHPALSAALAAIEAYITPDAPEKQLLIAAKCGGLMMGYHARWIDADYEVLEVEHLVESDLWNPSTESKSLSFSIAGKIDVITRRHGRRIIVDHKTTSDDIGDPDSPYWRQLVVEGQVSHYMLLEWLNGRKADAAMWDVVKKPGISPKKLSAADLKAVTMLKTYCGAPVSDDSIAQMQADGRETLSMYTQRLAEDCTTERPEWYFQRRQVPRLDNELQQYAQELWEHSQDILYTRRRTKTTLPPRNGKACMLYRTPCKFLGICSGHDEPDSDKWERKNQVHVELGELIGGDGRRVLTNSRIGTFQTCRRKHYYAYELGIEKLDEEEREALVFGTIWHSGQEAWWGAQRSSEPQPERTEHEYSDRGSSVNAVETAL